MAEATTFAATAGVSITQAQTADNQAPFTVAGVADIFGQTQSKDVFSQSASVGVAFGQTQSNFTFSKTAAFTPYFFVTPDPNAPQSLVLQISQEIGLATDCSTVTISDGTPTYDPDTEANPTGYNPESATVDPLRPKRSALDLWFCMREWTKDGVGETIFPTTQDGDLTPWTFTQPLINQGIYQLFMIGVPVGTDYAIYQLQTLPEYAANTPGWFVASVGAVLDCGYINCFNTKRRNYLNGIKCGKCDKGFQKFAGKNDSMNAALALLDFPLAIGYFDELEKECAKIGCKCGCSK